MERRPPLDFLPPHHPNWPLLRPFGIVPQLFCRYLVYREGGGVDVGVAGHLTRRDPVWISPLAEGLGDGVRASSAP